MIHPPQKKRDASKKLRKEINTFSKLLIFSTDCSQSLGLQSVIKIRGKSAKLKNFLRLPHRHFNSFEDEVSLAVQLEWCSSYNMVHKLRLILRSPSLF
jgi:hypothetical protein